MLYRLRSCLAGIGLLATATAVPAAAASIATYEFDQHGPDSLAFIIDSIAASSSTGPFSRYRISNSAVSSMGANALPNSNLVTIGSNLWFTTRAAPFRIGSADLSTVSGNPVYYVPAGISSAFDDMTLGPDGNLWATNAQSFRVVRITQAGVTTTYTGNGTIHPLGITRATHGNLWFADGANRRITRIDTDTGVFTDYAVPQLSAATIPERITGLGTVSNLVWFATHDGFGSVNPATGVVQVVATEAQQPRRLLVGADGTLWLTNGTQYVTQFTPPANYAKLKVFSNANAESTGLYVDDAGVVYVSDRQGGQLARIDIARNTPADTTVTEFYNNILNHYFVTANLAEAAAIDGGSAGPGWSRTGETWNAWVGGPIPNAAEVCRFYGATDINPATGLRRGPNSHFYTLGPGECAGVKLDPGWTYEFAGKFWMVKPAGVSAGACPAWTQPVYRAYNNRFAFNDSNHRYMTSVDLYDQMVGMGWSGEGVVMCAPL
jgi:streptogramin lyase